MMASMRSPRTQCCCCAVGVFAAMFGIFMLSAGICIVLNVNYMEVDTSGLPPDLHNEDGKRIVGIILICVAICTLGLSATVSIVYFAICNRSSRPHPSAPTSSSIANGSAHGHSHNSHNSSKHASSKASKGANGSARPSTHSGNPLSLSQRRQANPSPGDRVMVLAAPSVHGQSPSSGQKRGHGRKNMQKIKNHSHSRLKNKSYRFGLPTHTEEDPEAAKSAVDLKSHQRINGESSSSSGSSMAPSQIGSTINDDSRTAHVSTTSFIDKPTLDKATPVIVISDSMQNTPAVSTNMESVPTSGETDSETIDTRHDIETHKISEQDAVYHENELVTTTDSVTSSSPPPPNSSSFSTSHTHNVSDDFTQTQGYANPAFQSDNSDIVPRSVGHSETNSLDDDPSKNDSFSPPPPATSGQQTAFPQYPLTGTTSPDAMIPSRIDLVDEQQLTDQDSVNSSNHSILQVKPHTGIAEDHISDLPPSSRHHDRYKGQSIVDINSSFKHDLESRSESRSSFNSAFSTDGDDPDREDREEMQEKLRQLIK